MKKARRCVCVAFAAVLVFALAPAHGAELSPGEKLLKFRDESCLFAPDGGGARVPVPLSDFSGVVPGLEQRTIFRTTTIFNAGGAVEFDTSSPTELTGVIYDLELVNVQVSGSTVILDFAPLGRNPFNGDVDGDRASIPVTGGVVEVYEDAAKNYTADPGGVPDYDTKLPALAPVPFDAGNGPSHWVEGGAGHSGPAGADSFTRTTDGDYWLAAVLIDLNYLVSIGVVTSPAIPFGTGVVARTQIDLSTGTGHGFAYANVVGGSFEASIERSRLGNLVDIALLFDTYSAIFGGGQLFDTLLYAGPGQWTLDSQDPVVFFVTEPGNGGGEGGTPGFWKAKNHQDAWIPTGFSQGDSYEAVFGVDLTGKLDGLTLLEGVKLGGGGEKALIRHSVAAILNAGHPGINYDLSVADVIQLVQDAFNGLISFTDAKDILEAFNEQPHPL